jgi:membrane associated rhomboid family serine protease
LEMSHQVEKQVSVLIIFYHWYLIV